MKYLVDASFLFIIVARSIEFVCYELRMKRALIKLLFLLLLLFHFLLMLLGLLL